MQCEIYVQLIIVYKLAIKSMLMKLKGQYPSQLSFEIFYWFKFS